MVEDDPRVDGGDGPADARSGAYLTVAERATAEFTVRGSRFLGHVAPARDVEAAEDFVETVRRTYDDATHNVPAYRVRVGAGTAGRGMLREYGSDEGEPSGSAGEPALSVLRGRDLEGVVAVVTRYYGGTELGVGGLVRAYSRAVAAAVDAAGTVEAVPRETVRAVVDYDDSGTVRGVLESAGVPFEAEYGERVAFTAEPPIAEAAALRDRLRSATSGRVELDASGE